MRIELTTRSASAYDRLRVERMTPAMAAEYLRDGQIVLRTFGETLRDLYPGEDLQTRLVDAFLSASPSTSADSLTRTIRNWLSGRTHPVIREDIFHIAFALGLSEEGANCLLGLCCDYGIHCREGRDVIYAWFLRHGGSYEEARAFFETLPAVPRPDGVPPETGGHVTQELQASFQRVQTIQDLRACYEANLERFGRLHLRAFHYFQKYMNVLTRPTLYWDAPKEPDYSPETVMEKYLSLRMPSQREKKGYSVIQKLVKRSWPNTTALKNIRLRKEDVPRKLILLLYVVTENMTDDAYSELDETYLTSQERLEDHWWTINAILTDCGMPPLDPRNAFDWLVLYAVAAEDESMSERMEQVIDYMYADVAQNTEKKEKPSP